MCIGVEKFSIARFEDTKNESIWTVESSHDCPRAKNQVVPQTMATARHRSSASGSSGSATERLQLGVCFWDPPVNSGIHGEICWNDADDVCSWNSKQTSSVPCSFWWLTRPKRSQYCLVGGLPGEEALMGWLTCWSRQPIRTMRIQRALRRIWHHHHICKGIGHHEEKQTNRQTNKQTNKQTTTNQ